MPRSRRLPSRWTWSHGRIYYVVPLGQEADWDGKRWYPLGRTEAEAYRTWAEKLSADLNRRASTMHHVFDRYLAEILTTKAPSTQRNYLASILLLKEVFGHMVPGEIEPVHIRAFRDRRPRVAGNRDVAALSSVLSEAVEWGLLSTNPCKEVRRRTERPRDRLVKPEELADFVADAPALLRAYIPLKLAVPARQAQLLSLRLSQWRAEDEVLVVPGVKGGRDVEYEGPAVRSAVEGALALRSGAVRSMYIIATRDGTPYTPDGFRSIWQRHMRVFVDRGGERFTEHDLRAMVASKHELERAQALLGHTDPRVTARVYQRGPVRVKGSE